MSVADAIERLRRLAGGRRVTDTERDALDRLLTHVETKQAARRAVEALREEAA